MPRKFTTKHSFYFDKNDFYSYKNDPSFSIDVKSVYNCLRVNDTAKEKIFLLETI